MATGGEFVEGWLVAQVLGEGAYGEWVVFYIKFHQQLMFPTAGLNYFNKKNIYIGVQNIILPNILRGYE